MAVVVRKVVDTSIEARMRSFVTASEAPPIDAVSQSTRKTSFVIIGVLTQLLSGIHTHCTRGLPRTIVRCGTVRKYRFACHLRQPRQAKMAVGVYRGLPKTSGSHLGPGCDGVAQQAALPTEPW